MEAPKIFGLEHILYLLVSILSGGGLIFFVPKKIKTERQINLTIKIIAIVLLAAIIFNRLSIAITDNNFKGILPGSFCGLSSLALAIIVLVLKRDNVALHSVAYVVLLGSIITLVYPDFIGQSSSIFYPKTISGLLHHTISLILVIIMLITGYLKPDLKKWHLLPLGLSIYMVYGLFLIGVLDYGDAMYINKPILDGTSLYWYVLGPIFLLLHLLFLLAWKYWPKRKNKQIVLEESKAEND